MEESPFTDILHVDDALRAKQIERLERTKSSRNSADVQHSLSAIRDSATSGENLMPKILAAVESYATLGEISDTLRNVWGEYEE